MGLCNGGQKLHGLFMSERIYKVLNFQLIYGVFVIISTIAIISLVFENQLIQYVTITAMIGLCVVYALIAIFNCSTKVKRYLYWIARSKAKRSGALSDYDLREISKQNLKNGIKR